MLCLFSINAFASPTLPKFSNDAEENWYYIVFSAGEAVLSNQGKSLNAITVIPDQTKPAQLWKFVGNADEFIIVNKRAGEFVTMKANVNASDKEEDASLFKLIPCGNPNFNDSWEIEYIDGAEVQNHWHQWYKTGTGVNISL